MYTIPAVKLQLISARFPWQYHFYRNPYRKIKRRPSLVYEWYDLSRTKDINTLRPRQNGRHFADDTFKHIFLNENVRISLKISLKFVPKVGINSIPALVPIMARRRPGDKPLSEAMMDCLLTHICVTRPQWVNDKRVHLTPNNNHKLYVSKQDTTTFCLSCQLI